MDEIWCTLSVWHNIVLGGVSCDFMLDLARWVNEWKDLMQQTAATGIQVFYETPILPMSLDRIVIER